jgi:glyceraldehyde 3-phosphate dehydrogenase
MVTVRLAINGFGRMGRLFTRAAWDSPGLEIVGINDPGAGADLAAHLLEFDTMHGRWPMVDGHSQDGVSVDGRDVAWFSEADPQAVPWRDLGAEVMIECSGRLRKGELLEPYLEHGVSHVLVAAPVKDGSAVNVVYGVNHSDFDPSQHRFVTAASCTTNCLAPVVKVLHEGIGISHGSMTTLHDMTNTQSVVDAFHKDPRRARAASQSMIPTSTGSATAIGLIFPDLQGRLDGHAVRVPLINSSLTDCVFEVERKTTVEEVNGLLESAARGQLAGILGYEEKPLVSADYRGESRSAVIDAPSTLVTGGTQVKIYAWYDNEWGYVKRMVDIVKMIASARDATSTAGEPR